LTAELAEKALRAFPTARLVTTYGMSEIGLVGTRTWTSAPIEPSTFDDVMDGIELDLVDDGDGEGAEIVLRSKFLLRGYYDIETRAVRPIDAEYKTGDLGERLPSGVLRLRARKKHVAKVAGVLVNLDEICRLAKEQGAVADCCAVGVEHPIFGEDVHLFVVKRQDATLAMTDLARFIATKASLPRAPRIHAIDAIPRTAMGKVSRETLARMGATS
jgi:acyl-CoA synthetase (AMP-forming)/AMP-acid ligase II